MKVVLLIISLLWGCGNAIADEMDANKGRDLYHSYGCALCHGREGKGNGPNAQSFDPPPTDFHDPKAYLHGSDRDSLRRSIQYGIKEPSSIMPAFEHIPPEELGQLIDYLLSLQISGTSIQINKGVSVSQAWVQAMPPSQTISAAYLTITNNSSREVVLTSVSSDMAGAVELHQMSRKNGMMHMARVDKVSIPAKAKLSLQPGGYHIMLIDLKKPVTAGVMVPLTLHFQDGTQLKIEALAKNDE